MVDTETIHSVTMQLYPAPLAAAASSYDPPSRYVEYLALAQPECLALNLTGKV